MTDITGVQPTIEVLETGAGMASIRQTAAEGGDQTIVVDYHQAEVLGNWLTQFVRTTREDLSDD